MRLCGLVLCKRILLALLLDKVSRGTGRLPWVPLPASPPFCFRSTNPPKQNGGQVMTTINMNRMLKILTKKKQNAIVAAIFTRYTHI